MYVCIDVGGTKTLVACLDDNGIIIEEKKIATSQDYQDFLENIKNVLAGFQNKDFTAGAIGVPAAEINRQEAIAVVFGNLPWENVSIASDIQSLTNCPMFIENDTKLAGLSEAMLLKDRFSKVLYITISTGIGISIVQNLKIVTALGDAGGRILLIQDGDKFIPWEHLASGKSIVERYGKMAKDIDDEDTWKQISQHLAQGLIQLISIFQPEVVVFGGSVGNYFNEFNDFLTTDIANYKIPLIKMPLLKEAERPDQAVIYGCYDYAKQRLSNG